MTHQSAKAVALVLPALFAFNPETSRTNRFQHRQTKGDADVQGKALRELRGALAAYTAADIDVRVFTSRDSEAPDALFPNAAITFDGADLPFGEAGRAYAILCPMLEASRQRERAPFADFLQNDLGYKLIDQNIFERDLDFYEAQDLAQRQALEGTGSLALDRIHKIAYCALSPRSDAALAAQLCRAIGYRLMTFRTAGDIYHTDLVMMIGSGYALICSAVMQDGRQAVLESLHAAGLEVFDLSPAQHEAFCLNAREVRNRAGRKFLFMSSRAHAALDAATLAGLARHGVEPLHTPLDTIETFGGGSGCCITQELHGLKSAA